MSVFFEESECEEKEYRKKRMRPRALRVSLLETLCKRQLSDCRETRTKQVEKYRPNIHPTFPT
ncbi:MAG: hypothetical protein QNJ68_20830 [Microcoleaceae cyanobacterium MO_207.B10]|nr:hypothetical protein [Microcoleaceae cyanobacterium MO_207.B10]